VSLHATFVVQSERGIFPINLLIACTERSRSVHC